MNFKLKSEIRTEIYENLKKLQKISEKAEIVKSIMNKLVDNFNFDECRITTDSHNEINEIYVHVNSFPTICFNFGKLNDCKLQNSCDFENILNIVIHEKLTEILKPVANFKIFDNNYNDDDELITSFYSIFIFDTYYIQIEY